MPGGGEACDEPHEIILDSCLVLNLYATGRMEEIVRALELPVAVTDFTRHREATWVGSGRRSDIGSDVEMVDLSLMIHRGTLRERKIESEREADLLVEMAALMDEGEAIAAAIALARNLFFGSDDRRARSVLSRHVPPVRLLSTAQIIRSWATRENESAAAVATVLAMIRKRARFGPPADDPLFLWWVDAESRH